MNYTTARSRKAQIEHEQHLADKNEFLTGKEEENTGSMTVSEFLYEFIEKYGEKRWGAASYEANIGLMQNYIHPYIGERKLTSIKTKTIDDYYHFFRNRSRAGNQHGKIKT